jgi:hypothetical protein
MIDVDARSIRMKCGLDSKFVQRADKVSAKPIKLCLVIDKASGRKSYVLGNRQSDEYLRILSGSLTKREIKCIFTR